MFLSKKRTGSSSRIDSLIGADTQVTGDIAFRGGLRVDGAVRGNIRSTGEPTGGTLVVSEHARVEGDIEVPKVIINGVVDGSLISAEFIELQPHARVTGDVHYNMIEIHLGAVIQGSLVHQATNDKAVELKLAAAV
jgi:cytoskeletal protein CcmA (bactofilin family)